MRDWGQIDTSMVPNYSLIWKKIIPVEIEELKSPQRICSGPCIESRSRVSQG
jgi:hypothetical protein